MYLIFLAAICENRNKNVSYGIQSMSLTFPGNSRRPDRPG